MREKNNSYLGLVTGNDDNKVELLEYRFKNWFFLY